VVSDCGAIVDVNQGHKKTADITHSAALALEAGTDLSCSIWTPGFNTLADAVHQGLVSEDLVTQAAERLYTARFQLGLFDPQGSSPLDNIHISADLQNQDREVSRKAAQESIVLLKNTGILPMNVVPGHIAVVGPTADLLPSILGNYVGTPVRPVTPLDGMLQQFKSTPILYAQGSTLAAGVGVPVPRTAFGLSQGLKTEFFATGDWTGRPVATLTQPEVQADWENALPVNQLATHNYSVRWTGSITAPAPGHYVFSVEPGTASPTLQRRAIALSWTARWSARQPARGARPLCNGQLQGRPGASPTAPPVMDFPRLPPSRWTSRTPRLTISALNTPTAATRRRRRHPEVGSAGPGQLDEAVARAKEADVVVAFVACRRSWKARRCASRSTASTAATGRA